MGYVYRPRLKGPTPPPGRKGHRCQHKRHGREDTCPGCGARFSPVWWVKYYVDGTATRESTGTAQEAEARRFLKRREGKALSGEPVLPRVDRVRYEEAAADLRTHYQTTGERDLAEAGWRFAHLDPFFGTKRLASIGPADLTCYIAARQAEGAANGSINQELGVLGRLLRLAYENGKLLRLPIIHKPKAAAPRSGFFERSQFEAVKRQLRRDLQVAVTIAYAFGWRTQSEVLRIQRAEVDLAACTIRIPPGRIKNDDGRVVSLTLELVEMLRAQDEQVQLLEMDLGHKVPHLFPYLSGEHKGHRIQDFRKAWQTACLNAMLEELEGEARAQRESELKAAVAREEKPGLLKMLRHDFRRTGVRNMVNRGVPERVAMTVTGHKTRNVFDRYHIASPADLQEAARKLTGTFSGTLPETRRGSLSQPPVFAGGADGTRTRDLRRDRPAF
jgi:Phage integrase family